MAARLTKSLSLFDRTGVPVLVVTALALAWLESRQALRVRKTSRLQRAVINSSVAAVSMVGMRLALLPALVIAARHGQRTVKGIVPRLPLPSWGKWAVSLLLLDYGNYWWHRLMHRWSWLWRLHLVHHTDVDMDVTTAWRFHVGEMLASIVFRGGVARIVAPSGQMLLMYEIVYEAATAFHHSNWKLPPVFENQLNRLLVTPRMHGIHHSVVKQETDSNYSVVFAWWDQWHGTTTKGIPQEEITIGVPAYSNPQELMFPFLMKLPFGTIRPWKRLDGSVPVRMALAAKR